MVETGAILFPHCFIGEQPLERITGSFNPISLCLPYFMEPLEAAEGQAYKLQILYPPALLRPEADFKRVLREYQGWMEQNRDKGYAAVLTLFQEGWNDESSWWGIRKMIQERGQGPTPSGSDNGFKGHLVLHLARHIEEAHNEAGRLLERLRTKPSPLMDAIEDGATPPGPLSDLVPQEYETLFSGPQLRQILEAWFGLFGSHVPASGTLLTLARDVFDFVKGLFEEFTGGLLYPEKDSLRPPFHSPDRETARLPVLESHHHQDPLLEALSGKTLVLAEYCSQKETP